jgi:hypothetical protein
VISDFGEEVKAWLEGNREWIEGFYLPSYSPEVNPDEYRNGDLKDHIRSGLPVRVEKELTKKTRSCMRKLQNWLNHVQNYFKHPKIDYAAKFQCLVTGAIITGGL